MPHGCARRPPTTTVTSGSSPLPANLLLVDDGRLEIFDPSWRFATVLPDDVLLVRGLRDFARRLLRSGAEHPWASDISP
jgi:hypothetical protein